MSLTQDVYSVYERFGNMFALDYQTGCIYEVAREPETEEEKNATIYWEGHCYTFLPDLGLSKIDPPHELLRRLITKQFLIALKQKGYKFQADYLVYHPSDEIQHNQRDIFSIFKGFNFRTLRLGENLFLCVDPHLTIVTNATLKYLTSKCKNLSDLSDFSVRWNTETEGGIDGYLIETICSNGSVKCKVKNYRTGTEEEVDGSLVYPEPRPELLERLITIVGGDLSVISLQRKLSFLDSKEASRDRFFETLEIIRKLKTNVFPIKFGDFKVELDPNPVVVRF
jgi:hypothetical protein